MCYNKAIMEGVSLYCAAPLETTAERGCKAMAYNEKQKEYTMNYMKEKLDEIKFRVPKGKKALIREHAEKQGEKLTPFIIRAIDETMERDNQKSE